MMVDVSTISRLVGKLRGVLARTAGLVRLTQVGAMADLFAERGELQFLFEERRAVQAYAFLLDAAGGQDNYTRVLKILYLGDRTSLLARGRLMTGSTFVSMKNGPVLSEIYNFIKRDPASAFWDEHIVKASKYDVRLIRNPGDSELSEYDVSVLTDLSKKYKDYDYSEMIDVVHKLREWRDPSPDLVAPLRASDILRGAGETDATIEGLAKQNEYFAAARRIVQ